MLYVTTRNRHDAFTAHRAIHEERAPDGGSYLPFRMPNCDQMMLADWSRKPFGQVVAEVLNMLLPTNSTGWDVEFSVGRHPVRFVKMGRRVTVVQMWRNPGDDYAYFEKALTRLIYKNEDKPSEWVRMAIRMAALAGAVLQFLRDEQGNEETVDVAVNARDFFTPMAVWYLRQMGFPIGRIICSCDENAAVWDLLRMGETRTDISALKTDSVGVDAALPPQIERLICATLGQEEALRYSEICARGGVYTVAAEKQKLLQKGLYAAAVSSRRTEGLIQSVYTTNGCVVTPQAAKSYGGLLDYRAKTGENRRTLLFEDSNPVFDKETVCAATGLTEAQLRENLT